MLAMRIGSGTGGGGAGPSLAFVQNWQNAHGSGLWIGSPNADVVMAAASGGMLPVAAVAEDSCEVCPLVINTGCDSEALCEFSTTYCEEVVPPAHCVECGYQPKCSEVCPADPEKVKMLCVIGA
jgi:hypothetical protein